NEQYRWRSPEDRRSFEMAHANDMWQIDTSYGPYLYDEKGKNPSENTECFLEGLKRIFEMMESVPKTIRIDNLAAAVVKPRGKGEETVFTEAFERFAAHYRFEPIACNPYSGHEKGAVENKVGYIRYNFFDCIPDFVSYLVFEKWLNAQLEEDSHRNHYHEHILISELWEEDRAHMRSLSDTPYPVFRYEECKTNKYGEIRLDNASIHIPKVGRNRRLTVQLYWDSFRCLSPSGELLYEADRPYISESRPVDWLYVFQTYRQKPRALDHSKYKKLLPSKIKSYVLETTLVERKRRIDQLLELLKEEDLLRIEENFEFLLLNNFESEPTEASLSLTLYDSLSPKAVS
ncbi:transposase, partial [Alkalibacterium sp. s-m-28]